MLDSLLLTSATAPPNLTSIVGQREHTTHQQGEEEGGRRSIVYDMHYVAIVYLYIY